MIAVVNYRAVQRQFVRYPAPVVEMLVVAEEKSVDEQYRIFGPAHHLTGARRVDAAFFRFEFDLFTAFRNDDPQHYKIERRYEPEQYAEHARPDSELYRRAVNRYDSVPEHHEFARGENDRGDGEGPAVVGQAFDPEIRKEHSSDYQREIEHRKT